MAATGQEIKSIVGRYKNMLTRLGIDAERIILFGSYAQGTATDYSDIDLIVISNDFERMNLRERLEILGVAAAKIMKPIEAKGYTSSEITKVSPLNYISEALKTGITF